MANDKIGLVIIKVVKQIKVAVIVGLFILLVGAIYPYLWLWYSFGGIVSKKNMPQLYNMPINVQINSNVINEEDASFCRISAPGMSMQVPWGTYSDIKNGDNFITYLYPNDRGISIFSGKETTCAILLNEYDNNRTTKTHLGNVDRTSAYSVLKPALESSPIQIHPFMSYAAITKTVHLLTIKNGCLFDNSEIYHIFSPKIDVLETTSGKGTSAILLFSDSNDKYYSVLIWDRYFNQKDIETIVRTIEFNT